MIQFANVFYGIMIVIVVLDIVSANYQRAILSLVFIN